ncbi:MAG: prepilin-type N-terminal cleavage/methylation domain-containing protein [Verrucomicrobiales bacterium]|nr:prepilin-type N-terminal cleavage/methylation domain-containing protein [Verrucomicrobiales bacterium]
MGEGQGEDQRPSTEASAKLDEGQNKKNRGFTLIELILIMAILVISFGVTFPTLKRFFQGRVLDHEARRLLALTRYAQNRAVTEGIPMVLWLDEQNRRYGLEPASGFSLDEDRRALEFQLDTTLSLEVEQNRRSSLLSAQGMDGRTSLSTLATPEPSLRVPNVSQQGSRLTGAAKIGFRPDGMLDLDSPSAVTLRQGELDAAWLVQTTNRTAYELRSEAPHDARR